MFWLSLTLSPFRSIAPRGGTSQGVTYHVHVFDTVVRSYTRAKDELRPWKKLRNPRRCSSTTALHDPKVTAFTLQQKQQHVSDGVCQHSLMHDLSHILSQIQSSNKLELNTPKKLVEQATSKLDNWATTRKTPTTCSHIVRTVSLEEHTCNQKFYKTLRNLLYRRKNWKSTSSQSKHIQKHEAVASNSPRSFRNTHNPCTCAEETPETGRQARPRSAPRLGNAFWGNTSSLPRSS